MEIINLLLILVTIFFSGMVGWKRLRQGNVSCLFYAICLTIFGIAQLLGLVLGADSSFSVGIRLKANLISIGVLVSLFLGENLVLRNPGIVKTFSAKKSSAQKNNFYLSVLLWVTFIISIGGFLLLIRRGGVSDLGRWLFSLIMISNYISLLKKRWIIFGIGTLLILEVLTVASARAFLLYIIGPLVYYYITVRIKKNFSARKAILLGLCIPLFFIVFETVHLWRWQPQRTPEIFSKYLFDKKTYFFLLNNPASEFNYRLYYFRLIELFPRDYGWLYGNTYKTVLLFWLPSGKSGGIKVDTMYKVANALTGTSSAYIERRSVQPTFTGDCYINFGYLFWLPALIWGMGLSFVHIKAQRNIFWNLLAGSTLVYFLALSLRGSISMAFFQIILCATFLVIMFVILGVPYKLPRDAKPPTNRVESKFLTTLRQVIGSKLLGNIYPIIVRKTNKKG